MSDDGAESVRPTEMRACCLAEGGIRAVKIEKGMFEEFDAYSEEMFEEFDAVKELDVEEMYEEFAVQIVEKEMFEKCEKFTKMRCAIKVRASSRQ